MQKMILFHTKTARILHWFNMFCITMLIITGFYIHSPLRYGWFNSMDLARKIHFILMYLLIYGIVIRIYYSYYSKDYKEIMFVPSDIKGFPVLIKYYLFITREQPDFGKYNPGQKLVYTSWIVFIVMQVFTGFILYFPTELAWLGNLMGGVIVVRQLHFLVTWVFVITVILHVYLAAIGGKHVIKSMITGYMPAGLHMQPSSQKIKS